MSCSPTPPAKSKNYIEPAELRRLTAGAQSRGPVRRAKHLVPLIAVWQQIARGCNRRYAFVRGSANIEDFVQDCVVQLLTCGLPNANPDQNLFSYYTRICQNVGRQIANARRADAEGFEAYRQELIATHVARGLDPDDSAAGPEPDDDSGPSGETDDE